MVNHTDPIALGPTSTMLQRLSRGMHVISTENGSTVVDRDSVEELRATECCILEDYTKCSESHLWKLMTSFYERKGPESWSKGIVPFFITSNASIARSYAKILYGYLTDGLRPNATIPINPNEPFYIIELGTGCGKFSFFVLKELEKLSATSDFPFHNLRYVMTDFTETNYGFWKNHPSLSPYFDRGILDCGIFDAVNDNSIHLWKSNITLSSNSLVNPICVVANYLFDTLYHDIFQVQEGKLYEGLVSTGSRFHNEPDPLDPEILNRLHNSYRYDLVPSDEVYREEEGDEIHLRRILDWYVDYFKHTNASVLLPIGALRALRRLSKFSNGRMLVISGDKGNNNPDQFKGLSDPHIAVHGSFSFMVNYHAISSWFTSKGGFSLLNAQEEASLKVGVFVLAEQSAFTNKNPALPTLDTDEQFLGTGLQKINDSRTTTMPYLLQAFRDHVESYGPNDFFVLQKSLKEDMGSCPLRTVIALIKLSGCDPDVFFKFREQVLQLLPSSPTTLQNDLLRCLPLVWENHFRLEDDKDLAFEIGRVYYGMRMYKEAIQFYFISLELYGDHHVTQHNIGLCFYNDGLREKSLPFFRKASTLNPSYLKAASWCEKVEKELNLYKEPEATPEVTPEVVPGMDHVFNWSTPTDA